MFIIIIIIIIIIMWEEILSYHCIFEIVNIYFLVIKKKKLLSDLYGWFEMFSFSSTICIIFSFDSSCK